MNEPTQFCGVLWCSEHACTVFSCFVFAVRFRDRGHCGGRVIDCCAVAGSLLPALRETRSPVSVSLCASPPRVSVGIPTEGLSAPLHEKTAGKEKLS